jgi:hypothetical protein
MFDFGTTPDSQTAFESAHRFSPCLPVMNPFLTSPQKALLMQL